MPLLAQRAVASPAVKGTLYIVGGGPQPPALVREFLDLAAQSGRSRIVVFGMASEEGKTGGDQSKLTAALGGSRTATAISSAIVPAQSLRWVLD